jgi:hypothetical protein
MVSSEFVNEVKKLYEDTYENQKLNAIKELFEWMKTLKLPVESATDGEVLD